MYARNLTNRNWKHHQLLSMNWAGLNGRGRKVKAIFTLFAQDLAKDAGKYLPQQPQRPTARRSDVHSMHSNKIPITMRADTSRSQFNASKPAALCAVGDLEDLDDTFDASCMVDLAAMTTRQEESTKKRKGNTPQDTSRTSRSAETHGR